MKCKHPPMLESVRGRSPAKRRFQTQISGHYGSGTSLTGGERKGSGRYVCVTLRRLLTFFLAAASFSLLSFVDIVFLSISIFFSNKTTGQSPNR